MKFHLQNQDGFSLVESLVSILLLSMAFTAVTGLFVVNISSASVVRNNFIAGALAQEGIELARNLRDSDWHAGRAFGSFGDAGGAVADGLYRVQWNSVQLLSWANVPLKRDASSGLFSYDTGEDTIFKREITVTTVSAVEKRVVVRVAWNYKTFPKEIVAEEHLFNWK